jgi:hypothetical protein
MCLNLVHDLLYISSKSERYALLYICIFLLHIWYLYLVIDSLIKYELYKVIVHRYLSSPYLVFIFGDRFPYEI